MGQVRAQFEKQIVVKSNDPKTPEVSLTITADYTPLYDINPLTLTPKLAYSVNETSEFTTITRTDGHPLRVARLAASQPWITAKIEPASETVRQDEDSARIRVTIQRQGAPRRFTEFIHVYTADDPTTPVSNIFVYGQFLGEVSLTPEALYWNVADTAKTPSELPEALTTRRVTIRSNSGKPIAVKTPKCSLKEIKIELNAIESGAAYELIARLDKIPGSTAVGNLTLETSVKSQPAIELPIIVHVFKP